MKTILMIASTTTILAVGSANAADPGPLTYLVSHGGPVGESGAPLNPAALVGFNPQPIPPGAPPTVVDLQNPSAPKLINTADGGTFDFVFALQGLGDAVVPLPEAPNADGVTGFRQRIDGHLVDVNVIFGGSPVIPGTWESFNPQPDPPGDVLAGEIGFRADPTVTFRVSIDGDLLSFSAAPEPESWSLMILGFGLAGAALRQRSRLAASFVQGEFR